MRKTPNAQATADAAHAAAHAAAHDSHDSHDSAPDAAPLADPAAPPADPAAPPATVRARVLVACRHGRPDDIATLPAAEAAESIAAGELDADPAAVAYAEQLAAAA